MDQPDTRSSLHNNPSSAASTSASHSSQASRERPEAGDVAREAKEKAQDNMENMAGQARRQATDAMESQRHTAADQAKGFADALRRTAEQLDRQQQSFLASCANNCATNLDRMAGALHEKDVGTLFDHTRDFARRQPGVFLGGAVTAGFLLARFLKSSDERRHSDAGHSASPAIGQGARSPSRSSAPGTDSPYAHSNLQAQTPQAREVDPHGK